MNRIEIDINGENADYKESASLPVSLTIKTDKFFEVIGTEGTVIDNPAKQLIFPPTLNNQRIIEGLEGVANVAMRINGSTIFRGTGTTKLKQRAGTNPTGYSMGLTGGVNDLFATLKGATLRGLDLGTVLFDGTNIVNSWPGSYDAGDKVVFAPVLYGYTGAADNNMEPEYLRPHVYFATIMQGIWEKLEVKIESQFFQTDYFKKFVYLFGVGDQWDAGGSDAQALRASNTSNQVINAGGTPTKVVFPDDLNSPNFDTANIWVVDTGAATAGTWTFSGTIGQLSNLKLEFVIDGLATIPINANGPWSLGPIFVPSTTNFYIQATQLNTTSPGTVFTGGEIRANRSENVALGSIVNIATCLHNKKITEFLAGCSHMWNLCWYYDPMRKVLHVEPRFDYELNGVWYEGFYKRIVASSSQEEWTDKFDKKSYSLSPSNPFGDWLILNNQPEDSPWYEQAAANGVTEGVPFLGARYDFSPVGKNGKTVLNPFFENILIADGGIGAGGPVNCKWMPTIMEEPEDGASQFPDPTYESEPKYAWYAGEVTGPSFKYNGSVTSSRPELIFKPAQTNIYDNPYCVAYSDYYTNLGGVKYLPGLMRTFYPQWLAMHDRGEVLEGNIYFDFSDIQPRVELFRDSKTIRLEGGKKALVFLGVSQLQPLKQEPSKSKLITLVQVRESDIAKIKNNLQLHYNPFEI